MIIRKFVLFLFAVVFTVVFADCQSVPPVKADLPDYVSPQKIERAIILPGGAFRGAFQAGALYYLTEEYGLYFQMVTGVSIGALNGAAVAQRNVALLRDFWLGLRSKEDAFNERIFWGVVSSLLFNKTGVHDLSPLEATLDKFADLRKLRTSGVEFWVGVVNYQTNEYEEKNQGDPDFMKFVLASASVPAFFPLVDIGGYQYADGGVRHMVSYMPAFNAGVKEIIVILPFNRSDTYIPSEKKYYKEHYDNFVNVLVHTIEVITHQVYKSDVFEMVSLAQKRGVNLIFIEPQAGECDYGVMDFDKNAIAKCLEHGYTEAQKLFPQK